MKKLKQKLSAAFFLLTFIALKAQTVGALGRPPADPNAPPPPVWIQFFPFAFMLLVFYFLLIRPQMKQKKERQKMIDSIKRGDKVITQGGLIVTVVNLSPTTADVKLNEDVRAKVLRSSLLEVYKDSPDTSETSKSETAEIK